MKLLLEILRLGAASFGRAHDRGVLAVFVAAALLMGPAQPAAAIEVIVRVFDNVDPEAVAAKYRIAPQRVFRLSGGAFSADIPKKLIDALDADPNVQEVEEDRVIARRKREPRGRDKPLRIRTPGRPYDTPEQPPQKVTSAIQRIGADRSPTAGIDGRDDRRVDADIAILDSHVDPYHPDLNVVRSFDCAKSVPRSRPWAERDSHGTFVAGVAAAIDNDIGIVGVAPGARIWSVNVFEDDADQTILLSSFECALEYVLMHPRINVVNMSFVFGGFSTPCIFPKRLPKRKFWERKQVDIYHEKICRAYARGVTFVAAAGNEAIDAYNSPPADYPEVLAVSAIIDFDGKPGAKGRPGPECYPEDIDDTFAFFSNYGEVVDVAAPGVCIESTISGGYYGIGEGTSYSAPFVAGAAALLYARYPGISSKRVGEIIRNRAKRGTIVGDPDGIDEGVLDVSSF